MCRFVERIHDLTGDGVDVALDGIGGGAALGSYRTLRRGGRLVIYGHYGTTVGGRKRARKAALFYRDLDAVCFNLAGELSGGRSEVVRRLM